MTSSERWVSCAEAARAIGKPGSRALVRRWAVDGSVRSKMITPRRMEVWLPDVLLYFDRLPSAASARSVLSASSESFDTSATFAQERPQSLD